MLELHALCEACLLILSDAVPLQDNKTDLAEEVFVKCKAAAGEHIIYAYKQVLTHSLHIIL